MGDGNPANFRSLNDSPDLERGAKQLPARAFIVDRDYATTYLARGET